MNHLKEEKALRLYEAIGELDQMMVNNALRYKKKNGISTMKLAVIIAACMAVLVAFAMVGAYLVGPSDEPAEEYAPLDELETLLYEKADENIVTDISEINYFSGEAELIWYDGDSYYLKTLGKMSELAGLDHYIGQGERVDSEAERAYRVWISCGDGRVISPYLESSAGNIGYCDLFNYDPEITPSDSFVNYIGGLLE